MSWRCQACQGSPHDSDFVPISFVRDEDASTAWLDVRISHLLHSCVHDDPRSDEGRPAVSRVGEAAPPASFLRWILDVSACDHNDVAHLPARSHVVHEVKARCNVLARTRSGTVCVVFSDLKHRRDRSQHKRVARARTGTEPRRVTHQRLIDFGMTWTSRGVQRGLAPISALRQHQLPFVPPDFPSSVTRRNDDINVFCLVDKGPVRVASPTAQAFRVLGDKENAS